MIIGGVQDDVSQILQVGAGLGASLDHFVVPPCPPIDIGDPMRRGKLDDCGRRPGQEDPLVDQSPMIERAQYKRDGNAIQRENQHRNRNRDVRPPEHWLSSQSL